MEKKIEETPLYYFGTTLSTCGHYFWQLENDRFISEGLRFPGIQNMSDYKKWPFNPEELPKSQTNGDVEYHFINGYSIIAICGSCRDSRPASKSVFFIKGEVNKCLLIEKIKSIPVADKIIKQMPFEVKWTQLLQSINSSK